MGNSNSRIIKADILSTPLNTASAQLIDLIAGMNPKNYLINGGFDFFQRNSDTSPTAASEMNTTAGYVCADRWIMVRSANGDWTTPSDRPRPVRSTASVPSNGLSSQSLSIPWNPNNTGASFTISQRIEGSLAQELVGKAISLSFWTLSNNQQITVSFRYANTVNNFSATTLIGSATVFPNTVSAVWRELKIENFQLSGNVENGLEILFQVSNVASSTSCSFSQMMLTATPVARAFRRHGQSMASELVACQRFYEKSYALLINPSTASLDAGAEQNLAAVSSATRQMRLTGQYKVTKRASPTVVIYDFVGNATQFTLFDSGGSPALNAVNPAAVFINEKSVCIVGAGITTTYTGMWFHWTASSEL